MGMASPRARRRVRFLGLAVIALAIVLLYVSTVVSRPEDQRLGDALFNSVALWFLVPGVIVVLRRDGHVVGWLLIVNALTWAIQLGGEGSGGGLAWMAPDWRAWIVDWVGYAAWTATVALFVVFPDGMAGRTRKQRRAGRIMIGIPLVMTGTAMLAEQVGGGASLGRYANPTGLGVVPAAVAEVLIGPVAIAVISSVVSLWRRARHVTGARRRQYIWVKFAFSLVMVGLAIGLAFSEVAGDLAWAPIAVSWFGIPMAFSIAILRHRLYDIDRIVSRTVAYGLITIVTAGIYAIPVLALPELFDVRGSLPVAAATLAAAAAFAPVRRVVQQSVDRSFNRARVDAQGKLDAFAGRMRAQVELDTILLEVETLVHATLQPRAAAVWIRPGQQRLTP
jgi:hypothetical protein